MLRRVTRRSARARAAWLVQFASFALASGAPLPALADSHALVLEWVAPTSCPTREQMEERIARVAGVSTRARESMHARAILAIDGRGVTRADVELTTSEQRLSRHVEGESCAVVSDALVLIIALAIEPDVPSIAPVSAGTPTLVDAPRRPEGAPSRRSLFVSASARLDVASLPGPAFGGELAVGWNPRHFDFELGAALLAPSRRTLAGQSTEGADIRLTDLGGRACYELFDAPVDVGPCAGLFARWLSAHGFGSDDPHDVTAVFGVASFGGLAKLRVSPAMTLRFSADSMVPLSRPSFHIDGAGVVYQTQEVAFRSALGAELHF